MQNDNMDNPIGLYKKKIMIISIIPIIIFEKMYMTITLMIQIKKDYLMEY